jgi:hypothetical protein
MLEVASCLPRAEDSAYCDRIERILHGIDAALEYPISELNLPVRSFVLMWVKDLDRCGLITRWITH